jgi:hypothetical protein
MTWTSDWREEQKAARDRIAAPYREALKAAFPKDAFTVRYDGWREVKVSWIDGPSEAAVNSTLGDALMEKAVLFRESAREKQLRKWWSVDYPPVCYAFGFGRFDVERVCKYRYTPVPGGAAGTPIATAEDLLAYIREREETRRQAMISRGEPDPGPPMVWPLIPGDLVFSEAKAGLRKPKGLSKREQEEVLVRVAEKKAADDARYARLHEEQAQPA